MARTLALAACLLVLLVAVSVHAQEVDLSPVKAYTADQAAGLKGATEAFLSTAREYYDYLALYDFDYAAAWADAGDQLTTLVELSRDNWLAASNFYESSEGIVAGVPSLSYFDVLLDAGPSAEEAPDEALDWTLVLPDGTELHSPGNLFHHMTEPNLFATEAEFVQLEADFNGDGEITLTEGLPDANLLLGAVERLDLEAGNLIAAVDAWEPTLEDTFTALVVMIPTMSEYFGQWKESAFIAGSEATETAFVATSRLFDITHILGGLDVAYNNIAPLIEAENADLNTQIDTGMDDLIAFVGDVYADEQAGQLFEQEEVDLLGTLAQEKAESLAALVAQAADALGVTLDLE